ncbi:hypothetical protein [Streptomyces sp. B6B3]|uniref:hypothetical protein n=1 Tax=Streptomyces sp. B6B3 TaxID=3153570 RepID=UPI00325E9551
MHGAAAVGRQALGYARLAEVARPALVNGAAALVAVTDGEPTAVLAFTVTDHRIVALDILTDPTRLSTLDLSVL